MFIAENINSASTVNGAFNKFLKNTINLNPTTNAGARTSRDWLVDRLHEFPQKDSSFPHLYSDMDTFFGSYARRTKKRPLDDIDMMICLSADSAWYDEYGDTLIITAPKTSPHLNKLCFDNTETLNSKKVINKFISNLYNVPQYDSAEIKRNQEAATLKLKSYEWNFDIVPCFFTKRDIFGQTFYVIPDGNGNWKKADPRIDAARVTKINQQHIGHVLNIIRVVKYWNNRPTMPSIPSYMLENMILDYYEHSRPTKASEFVDIEFQYVISYLSTAIDRAVIDPKKIQGDLNTLDSDTRKKISNRCNSDTTIAQQAREYESANDHRKAIAKWSIIFGDKFPIYTHE